MRTSVLVVRAGLVRRARRQLLSRTHRDSRHSQQGFSLVEILVSVVLIGTVILALAAGMLTLVRTSTATSERQQIQLALGSFAESLRSGPYLECQTLPADPATSAATYQAAYDASHDPWVPNKAGMTATITGIEFWEDGTAGGAGSFVAACPGTDEGSQRLTLQVDWRGRTGTAQVVTADRVTP